MLVRLSAPSQPVDMVSALSPSLPRLSPVTFPAVLKAVVSMALDITPEETVRVAV